MTVSLEDRLEEDIALLHEFYLAYTVFDLALEALRRGGAYPSDLRKRFDIARASLDAKRVEVEEMLRKRQIEEAIASV